MNARHIAALLLALSALSAAPIARAQCYCECPSSARKPFPHLRLATLPTNPRIFADLEGFDPTTLRLIESTSRETIPLVVEPADGASAFWIQPATELAQGRYYDLAVSFHPGADDAYSAFASFYTDRGADLDAASVDLGVVTLEGEPRYCADLVGGAVVGAFEDDDVQLVEVEVMREGALLGRAFVGGYGVFGTTSEIDADCFRRERVDGLVEGESLIVRARAWDHAGNATPFVETTLVTGRMERLPLNTPCPRWCAVSAPGHAVRSTLAEAVLALAVVLARRRRRPSKSA